MTLRTSLALALFFPIFASAAVPIGPARAVTGTSAVIAEGSQRDVKIASSGQETVVAWIDITPGRRGAYLAKVADDGTRIPGTQQLLVSDAARIELTWNGTSYLAFWSYGDSTQWAINLDGQLRPLTPSRIVRNSSYLTSEVAWNGNRGGVMSGRYLTIMDRDGKIVRGDIESYPGGVFASGRVASDGNVFFVVWQGWVDEAESIAANATTMTDLFVRRYTREGVPIDAEPVLIARTARLSEAFDVAFGGNRLAVVAAEPAGFREGTPRIYLLDPATLQITTVPTAVTQMISDTRVEWIGDRFVALWFRNDDDQNASSMITRTIAPDGTIGTPVEHTTAASAGVEPREVWNGRTLVVAFDVPNYGDRDVFATAADWRGDGASSRKVVALSPPWQSLPAIATNGQESLIVWTEGYVRPVPQSSDEPLRLAVAHMTAGVVDGPVRFLSTSAIAVRPAVVFTGAMYVVVWMEIVAPDPFPLILMQRISTTGEVLDEEPTPLARGYAAALAWNGTHVLVGWNSFDGVRAARMNRDGVPVDTVPVRLTTDSPDAALVAATNGSDFLLAWSRGYSREFPVPDFVDIYAARVDASGIASPSIAVATGPLNQEQPAVASDGRDFLIAYLETEDNFAGGVQSVAVKKVLREGALDGTTAADRGRPIATSEYPVQMLAPTIAATTNGYLIAWEKNRDRIAAELFVAGLDRSGAVNEAASRVDQSPFAGMWPMLATAGSSRGDLAYGILEQQDPEHGAALRLFVRRVGENRARGRAVRH
jgi:hypothetical protein